MGQRMSDGVLRPPPDGRWRLRRWAPPAAVAEFVAYGWVTEWQLPPGVAHPQGALPHPAGNVVVEQDGVWFYGPISDRFDRTLTGAGRVVGARLRPGVTGLLTGAPAVRSVDRRLAAAGLGIHLAPDAGADVGADVDAMLTRLFAALAAVCAGPLDRQVADVRDLAERVATDDAIRNTDDLARLAGCGRRTVQRRFTEHVGLSPSWIIRRYRLLRALGLAEAPDRPDWAELAAAAGYCDQSHLIRDFTGTVGASPTRYPDLVGGRGGTGQCLGC